MERAVALCATARSMHNVSWYDIYCLDAENSRSSGGAGDKLFTKRTH